MAENFPIQRVMMESDDLQRVIAVLAAHLHRDFPNNPDLVLLGIKTRGVYIAERLAEQMKSAHNQNVTTGEIDITLYRDDLSTLGAQAVVGSTEIGFDVTDKIIVLCDDVLFTGRTVRAALDEIVDFGRPKLIRLLVIVDRGMREYPVQAEYVGKTVDTDATHVVQVRLKEVDGDDRVLLCVLPTEPQTEQGFA
ncbi:MAG: bifunctional pyr operon transcriptional regulator/uracil phosphoribosyltransferase PyrR [Candidatus Sumerlaeaceae bacterium]